MLFCEITNAVLEYLANQPGLLGRFHEFFSFGDLEAKSNRLLKESFEKCGGKLNPELRQALLSGLEQHFRHDHGEKWYESSFDNWFRFTPRPMNSTFSLSVHFVEMAKEVVGKMDLETRKHCESIGELMGKYMDEGREYVRAHYHW